MNGVYEFLAQDRVVFGEPAAEAVSELAAQYGAKRVFLVVSKSLNRLTDEVDIIRQSLGVRYLGTFDDCAEHTPRASVIALTQHLRTAQPDLVVTVGGGCISPSMVIMPRTSV